MYLILPHKEAKERNIQGGLDVGLKGTVGGATKYRWGMGVYDDDNSYLDVGDGEGLTNEELNNCIETLE